MQFPRREVERIRSIGKLMRNAKIATSPRAHNLGASRDDLASNSYDFSKAGMNLFNATAFVRVDM